MTHISGQSLSRHLHQSPPCRQKSCLNCIHPPPHPSCIHLDLSQPSPDRPHIQHQHKLTLSIAVLQLWTERGKKTALLFSCLYLFISTAWALSHLLWQMIHSLLCELLKSPHRVWNLNKATMSFCNLRNVKSSLWSVRSFIESLRQR